MDGTLLESDVISFTDQPIREETVRTLLQAAMAARSEGDERPWHFVIVEDQATRERIAYIHPYAYMVALAPVAILVCGDLALQKHPGFWVQDCAAATENILVEAQFLGLGAVWLGIYPVEGRTQSFRNLFDLPSHVVPFALIPIGYPAEQNGLRDQYDQSRVHFGRW